MNERADSFKARWFRKERELGFEDIGTTMIPCGAELLPDSAAPFLSFDEAKDARPVWQVYGFPKDWPDADRARLTRYRVIGGDGAGNPFCIDGETGFVVLLDHEDRFRAQQFVNTTVRQLAECLLAFMGEDDPERFRSAVSRLDPPALAENAFWLAAASGIEA